MTIQEIQSAIQSLPTDELEAFRQWFVAFDGDRWDRQFEQDVAAGQLDRVAEEAISELSEVRRRKH